MSTPFPKCHRATLLSADIENRNFVVCTNALNYTCNCNDNYNYNYNDNYDNYCDYYYGDYDKCEYGVLV